MRFVTLLVLATMPLTAVAQHAGPRVLLPDRQGRLHPAHDGLQDVTRVGDRHRMRVSSVTEGKGENATTYYYLEHVLTKADGTEKVTRTASWNSDQKAPDQITPLAVRVRSDGTCYAVANRSYGPEKQRKSDVVLLAEGKRQKVLLEGESLSDVNLLLDKEESPILFYRGWATISHWYNGKETEVMFKTDYDWSVARDENGRLYVVGYNYSGRNLMVATALETVGAWETLFVDSAESGWQHSVAMHGGALYILYYYYRNAFNKGLKLALLVDGAVEKNQTYLRQHEFNAGWHPLLGIGSDGVVSLKYMSNVEQEVTTGKTFTSTAALLEVRAPDITGSWEDNYQQLFLRFSVMPSYQFWLVGAPQPSAEDANVRLDASYDYNPSFVTTFSGEARYGSFNLGLSYARSLITKEIEGAAGKVAGKAFQYFSGYIGLDDLIMGQDVVVSGTFGDFEGSYTDQNGSLSANTSVREIELGLLSQWRIRYGLKYRNYRLIQPVYAYYAPANVKAYEFVGAQAVDAQLNRFELFGGYSKLDYLSKYETAYSGLDLDGFVAGGIGIATFDQVELNGHELSSDVSLALRVHVKLGYAYYRRFHGLRGAGFFFRVGYEATYMANGFSAAKPEDRKDEDEDDRKKLEDESLVSRAAHHQLLHGPYLGLGVVW